MDILERLHKLQKEKGWTDYRIAKEADIPQGTITNIYKRNNMPTLSTLEAICKGFGLTLVQFFADENEIIDLTPENKELFYYWTRMSDEDKALFLQLAKKLDLD